MTIDLLSYGLPISTVGPLLAGATFDREDGAMPDIASSSNDDPTRTIGVK